MVLISCNNDFSTNEPRFVVAGVNGKVIGGPHNQGAPNVKVRIGNNTTMTDNYGNFYISGYSIPYDVYVSDSVSGTGSIIRSLDHYDIWVPNPSENLPSITTSLINVTVSDNNHTNKFKIFFTDGYNLNSMGENSSPTSGSCIVYHPDNMAANGRLYILEYNTNEQGGLEYYERFGLTDKISVSPGSTVSVNASDSVMKYNVFSSLVSGAISGIPQGYSFSAYYSLSISTREFDHPVTTAAIIPNLQNSFSFLVPGNIPVTYYPLIQVNVFDSSSAQVNTGYYRKDLPHSGGTGIQIQFPQEASIISPPENSFVDSNTVFTRNNQNVVLTRYIFSDSIREIHVYDMKSTITMKDFYKLGLGAFAPNSKITVSIEELGYSIYMSNFVQPNRGNLNNYKTPKKVYAYYMKGN